MTNAVSIAQSGSNNVTMRNRIINGSMVIDQRNNGASVSIPSAVYTYALDRWSAYASQASKFTIQQNAGAVTPPAGFTKYLGATVGASANVTVGAGDVFLVRQAIEGFNCADLGWGSAGAKTITVSFWVRSSLTGTFGGAINTNYGAYAYPFTYTINSANTWEQKTITIVGPTVGGTTYWPVDNQGSLRLNFSLGTGSTYSGTAGAWTANDYFSATGSTNLISTNSATWYMTGVQVEVGSTATPFEQRLYGTELQLCQRYAISYGGTASYERFGSCIGYATTAIQASTYFPVEMRTAPSLTNTAAAGFAAYNGTTLIALTALTAGQMSTKVGQIALAVASGATAGAYYEFVANGVTTPRLLFSAEL